MDVPSSIMLGITQGLSEFLPISSSAHILIISRVLGVSEPPLSFDIFVHMATLLAVVIYFYKPLYEVVRAGVLSVPGVITQRRLPAEDSARFGWLIVIATVPTGMLGLLFKDFFQQFFSSGWHIGFFLVITGAILIFAANTGQGIHRISGVTVLSALLVGVAQVMAIFPGISRSGATISMALVQGIERETAARFSFLLSIPAILGAYVSDLPDASGVSFTLPYLAGGVSAFVSGFLAIWLFMRLIQSKKFTVFGYYCFAVGMVIVVSYLF